MTGLALGIDIGTTGVRIAATERDAQYRCHDATR